MSGCPHVTVPKDRRHLFHSQRSRYGESSKCYIILYYGTHFFFSLCCLFVHLILFTSLINVECFGEFVINFIVVNSIEINFITTNLYYFECFGLK